MSDGYEILLTPSGDPGVAKLYPSGLQENKRGDAGVDLITPCDVVIPPGEVKIVDLGVKAVCLKIIISTSGDAWSGRARSSANFIPWAFRLVPRSSISKTPLMMANSEGIIDRGYRGPIKAAVRNFDSKPYTIEKGKALFQLVCADLSPPEYKMILCGDQEYQEYFGEGATERGEGGFGSTGTAGSAAREK